jgi:hypothetical protein
MSKLLDNGKGKCPNGLHSLYLCQFELEFVDLSIKIYFILLKIVPPYV